MRWIITIDHHGGCLGAGENMDGLPWRGTAGQADALPTEFRLYDARGNILFEGRCGDIEEDWWHGFEPLIYTWSSFRCRRMTYRRADSEGDWRPFSPCLPRGGDQDRRWRRRLRWGPAARLRGPRNRARRASPARKSIRIPGRH